MIGDEYEHDYDLRWTPTAEQHEILLNDAKYNVFLGGIGSGKTVLGCMWLVYQALKFPGSVGVVVAPTYTLIRDVIWTELQKWLPDEAVSEFPTGAKKIFFHNGSVVMFRTADSSRSIERLRGLTVSWFWIDEVTLLEKEVWNILVGRIRQPGYTHRGLITGTPKMNWVYNKFIKGPTDQMHIVKEVPTTANPFLSPDYIEGLRREYTGLFYEQEVLGKFVAFEGLVYNLQDSMVREPITTKFEKVVYGVDFGFTNPSAVCVIGKYLDNYYMVDEFYSRHRTDDDLIEVLKGYYDRYGSGRVFCDPSAPASISKMKRAGLNAVKADNTIDSGIRNMRALMDSGRFAVSPVCQNFIKECNEYEWEDNERHERPVPINDHILDATRYALLGDASKKRISTFAIVR